jgi:hypothetical protein
MKVFGWQFSGTSAVVRVFGPQELGGYGNLKSRLESISAKTGQSMVSTLTQVQPFPPANRLF